MKKNTVEDIGAPGRPPVHHYEWAAGSRVKIDAGKVVARFREIYAAHQAIKPEHVVEDARPKAATLHPAFTWDNKAAAEQWRREEAAHVMRSHMTVYTIKEEGKPDTVTPPTRSIIKLEHFHADEVKGDLAKRLIEPGVYAPVLEVMNDAEARRIYVRQAWFDFRDMRRKYMEIGEFASIFEEIDEVGKQLKFG